MSRKWPLASQRRGPRFIPRGALSFLKDHPKSSDRRHTYPKEKCKWKEKEKRTSPNERQSQGSSATPLTDSPPLPPPSNSPLPAGFSAIDWSPGEVEKQGTSADLGRKPSSAQSIGAGSVFKIPVRKPSVPTDRRKDPLGLTVIYEPETTPSLDIIFVHGLGGTSRATWAWDRDPQYFWPEKWLPLEPGIRMARILSFGYNASWASAGPAPITSIADFAKDLLFSMKFAKDDNLEELEMGQVMNNPHFVHKSEPKEDY
ncbi:hypothetical protein BDW71DRAFT_208334 [Aspergillus fruticulosus]